MQGFVKFFKADRGWGVIVSSEVSGDVWVHFSHIEGDGLHEFQSGDVVDFDVEEAKQSPFRFRAVRASFIRSGPAPTLHRVDEAVVVADAGSPDTPLTPNRRLRGGQVLDGP